MLGIEWKTRFEPKTTRTPNSKSYGTQNPGLDLYHKLLKLTLKMQI
jgi:hypothetical protein